MYLLWIESFKKKFIWEVDLEINTVLSHLQKIKQRIKNIEINKSKWKGKVLRDISIKFKVFGILLNPSCRSSH